MGKLVPWSKSPLEIGDVPVAIISLADAEGRRKTLIDRGFSPELVNGFWPACDMRGTPDSDLQSHSQYHDIKELYGRPPISAELGCFFSHSAIVEWLSVQESVSQVVVFEDDVVPEMARSLDSLIEVAGALSVPEESGMPLICHLGPRAEQCRAALARRVSVSGHEGLGIEILDLIDKKARLWRAHAYIINKAAAKKYTELAKGSGFLADDWRFIADQTQSKLVFLNPPFFSQDEEVESTIDPSNKRLGWNSPIRSNLSLNFDALLKSKYIYRKILSKLARIFRLSFAIIFRALPRKKIY